ncbi:hypothetical protein T05_2914 [Trichinella murrelli]|uniref:Uncharacterized protein n=1 Tax=Trichinella murrelli TaxID=144512 RepID=A0A0V0UCU9_9BILA|nr:hypothetical protein T05_2914 [Trichinella murrelli]
MQSVEMKPTKPTSSEHLANDRSCKKEIYIMDNDLLFKVMQVAQRGTFFCTGELYGQLFPKD